MATHDPSTPKRAIALRYLLDQGGAPEVVAKGRGELAERILALASEHGVPVREDPDLVELLAASEIGDEIPMELYAAVAQLLSFLFRLSGEQGS